MAKTPGRAGPKKQDDSDDIVDDPNEAPRSRYVPRSQGLRGGIPSVTRREQMDRDYPAQPAKPFRKGGKVAAKAKAKRK